MLAFLLASCTTSAPPPPELAPEPAPAPAPVRPPAPPPFPPTPGTATIGPDVLAALTHLPDGVTLTASDDGYLVAGLGGGTPLDQLGLQNGDRLRAVNGVKLVGPEAPVAALGMARLSGELALDLVRDGNPLELRIRYLK